jgi:hypothetical protein
MAKNPLATERKPDFTEFFALLHSLESPAAFTHAFRSACYSRICILFSTAVNSTAQKRTFGVQEPAAEQQVKALAAGSPKNAPPEPGRKYYGA